MQGAVGEGREKIIIASARASESRGASRGGATGVVNPSKNRCTSRFRFLLDVDQNEHAVHYLATLNFTISLAS